jgi:hypothetical protein
MSRWVSACSRLYVVVCRVRVRVRVRVRSSVRVRLSNAGWAHASWLRVSARASVAVQLKRHYRRIKHRQPDEMSCLTMGATAGSVAAVLTNPFDVVTTRLMVQVRALQCSDRRVGVRTSPACVAPCRSLRDAGQAREVRPRLDWVPARDVEGGCRRVLARHTTAGVPHHTPGCGAVWGLRVRVSHAGAPLLTFLLSRPRLDSR